MEAEVTIVFDIPIYIARYNGIIRLREEGIEEGDSPILPIPRTAILGDDLDLGTTTLNSSLELGRNEQSNSALMFTRLQGALLSARQIRGVLRSTTATTTFDAVRLLGLLSILRWRHTGERCVD